MPLARYFLFVGGALLALLLIADSCLPKPPVAERADSQLLAIRIHSERKWPERVVYDTSLQPIVPAQSTSPEADMPAPAPTADALAKLREAFAELPASAADKVQIGDPKKQEPKPQRQRKIAKQHTARSPFLMARQPQFGWYGSRFW